MFISTTHSIIDRFRVNLPKTPLFGTDGIRGKVGDLLTPSLAQQVGFWTGKSYKLRIRKKGL